MWPNGTSIAVPKVPCFLAEGTSAAPWLTATRKGAWLFHGDSSRRTWRADGPHFLGQIINHVVLDPRDGKTLLATASTGHLGPTMFRSTNSFSFWTRLLRPMIRTIFLTLSNPSTPIPMVISISRVSLGSP